ncbi:MAG: hypothetical protein ACRC5T_10530 [Cetobacterium sp.]
MFQKVLVDTFFNSVYSSLKRGTIMVKKRIDKTRFSIGLPIDLVIKLDMKLEKLPVSRNEFIVRSIEEKLNALDAQESDIEELKKEINAIKEYIKEKRA